MVEITSACMLSSVIMSSEIRVRIAPSPTGDPHVGTAYIALFNYVFAKKNGGSFVLRIEDTDRSRARADSERAIFTALRWVGLDWDEGPDKGGPFGPYRQSERLPLYQEHAQLLVDSGHAYRCFCTTERLSALRLSKRQQKLPPGYDRKCRQLDAEDAAQRAQSGEAHTIRLATPLDGQTVYQDKLRGQIEFANTQVDDQVLLKSDGFPTYHLANVVDDHLMKISHVIRAEEWISSTPKHVLLYQAFGWEQPQWIHMPLLRNSDKSKISKRKNPVSINYYQDAGILPQALLNFLANMGWSFGDDKEKFTLQEMAEVFDWDKVSLGAPVFDGEKLQWLNQKYLHELGYEAIADKLLQWRFSRENLLRILPLVRERIQRLDDFIPATSFFFEGDLDYTSVATKLTLGDAKSSVVRKMLLALLDELEKMPAWTTEMLEQSSRKFADDNSIKTKHLFMLLRLLVTGRKASPPLFETMEVLGKELCRRRLRQGALFIQKNVK